MGIFANEDLFFFVIHESVFFRSRGKLVSEPTTFGGITFHFFGDFSVIKARKLCQNRWKTCPFDELAD